MNSVTKKMRKYFCVVSRNRERDTEHTLMKKREERKAVPFG